MTVPLILSPTVSIYPFCWRAQENLKLSSDKWTSFSQVFLLSLASKTTCIPFQLHRPISERGASVKLLIHLIAYHASDMSRMDDGYMLLRLHAENGWKWNTDDLPKTIMKHEMELGAPDALTKWYSNSCRWGFGISGSGNCNRMQQVYNFSISSKFCRISNVTKDQA